MKHPEYSFVEIAMQGASNRGKVGDIKHMRDMTGGIDCYKTVYRYPAEFLQHWKENKNSVKGYTGPAYADWLPMDIDHADGEVALQNVRQVIQRMEIIGVDVNACKYAISGSKGWHVLVPSGMMGAEPSVSIHKRFRQVAEYLGMGVIDTAIYDKTRLFRIPNTINSKSGLYKVEFYPDEILNLSLPELQEIARNPRYDVDIEMDYDVNEELYDLYHNYEEKVFKPKGARGELPSYKTCAAKMMRDKNQSERNNTAVRIVSHLRDTGLTHLMAWMATNEWNDSLDGPLDTQELQTVFESAWNSEYSHGCNDDIKKRYCSEQCVLYKDEFKTETGRGK